MKRAKFLVLLLSLGFISYSQNLVINPGFESWSKLNKPSGWTHSENCLKDSATILSGQYSCQHTGGTSTSSDLGQTLAVVPGREYELSFSCKTSSSTSGNGARIWCYWKDGSGNSITDPLSDDMLRPSKYIKSEIWKNTSITITAPQSATSFYLEVRTYPNSVSYWDDFVFEEKTLTGFNEYSNPIISIYPNPATDILFIKNSESVRQYDVINISGVVLLSSKFNNGNQAAINIEELDAGIYIIRLYTSGSILNRRFIKRDD
jgi:hypothetical protein